MPSDPNDDRLSRIPTFWSVIQRAHESPGPEKRAAQEQILERYGGAVRRYLQGAVRDADLADDMYQDFAFQFLQGGLRGADPNRGRFRDFLKGVLFYLIIGRRRKDQRTPRPMSSGMPEPAGGETPAAAANRLFLASWKDELLAKAWASLEKTSQADYAVLRFRATHPELRSPEMAEQLGAQLGKVLTPANFRQMVHRAREKFAAILVEEVQQSLDNPSRDELIEELIDLELLQYCQAVLA